MRDEWNTQPCFPARLPAHPLLHAAQDRILDWWNAPYRENPDHPLAQRFALEASASLPCVVAADADLDSYYSALLRPEPAAPAAEAEPAGSRMERHALSVART